MAVFTSRKARGLIVRFANGAVVRFRDGKAEAEGDAARRLADYADSHPEYEIERTDEKSKAPTRKERAQAEAQARGLDTSGTVAQIEARIAEHDAAQNDGSDGEGDSEDADAEGSDEDADSDNE